MVKLALASMLLVVTACSDDGGSEPAPRTFGAMCTTVADTGAADCDSGVCTDAFDMIGHNVCSVKCTDASVCPEGSEGKKCNMKGYCKP